MTHELTMNQDGGASSGDIVHDTAPPPAVQQLPRAGGTRGRGQVPLQPVVVEHVGGAWEQGQPVSSQSFAGHPQLRSLLELPVQEMFLDGAMIAALCPPSRKGEDTFGRKNSNSANHVTALIKKPSVFHYNLELSTAPPSALFRKRILQWLELYSRMLSSMPVFGIDRIICTARRISGFGSKAAINFLFERKMTRDKPRENYYAISIQPTGEVEVGFVLLAVYYLNGSTTNPSLCSIQALEIDLKYGAQQKVDKVQVGGCILQQPPPGRCVPLQGSLRLAWRPLFNLDATQRAFLMSGKTQVITEEMLRARVVLNQEELGKKIAFLKVTYNRGGFMATVGLGCNEIKEPVNKCDGKMVTVQQHFEQKMGINLQRINRNLAPMEVLELELSAIWRACLPLDNDDDPPITFLVFQKRNDTHLFLDNPRDECGRGKNVPPGTVVDSNIAHPNENDFFLGSHQGIQGTICPIRYHLLWYDLDFNADDLQLLTYFLCYVIYGLLPRVSYSFPSFCSHLPYATPVFPFVKLIGLDYYRSRNSRSHSENRLLFVSCYFYYQFQTACITDIVFNLLFDNS